METKIVKCPKCGSEDNFHYNYNWADTNTPIIDVLCNECGEVFELDE